jgi:hypothetical protein
MQGTNGKFIKLSTITITIAYHITYMVKFLHICQCALHDRIVI